MARLLTALLLVLLPAVAAATSSSKASKSPLAGNGHNVTFDGKVYVVRQSNGWYVRVLRPQNVAFLAGGKVSLEAAFSTPTFIHDAANDENALALCEVAPEKTPYTCNDAGQAADGPYHCYDLVVFDSNAAAQQYNGLRRRTLKLWITDLHQSSATLHKHTFGNEGIVPVTQASGADMRGIEPTVTQDG